MKVMVIDNSDNNANEAVDEHFESLHPRYQGN